MEENKNVSQPKENMTENDGSNQPKTESEPTRPLNKVLDKLKPLYDKIDSGLGSLIPNGKLRKIIISASLGLVVFLVLMLLLGILISATRPQTNNWYSLNKPSISQNSPEPEKTKTEMQTKLMQLENEINNLKFPPSELTPPTIEVDIKIK